LVHQKFWAIFLDAAVASVKGAAMDPKYDREQFIIFFKLVKNIIFFLNRNSYVKLIYLWCINIEKQAVFTASEIRSPERHLGARRSFLGGIQISFPRISSFRSLFKN